MYIYTTRPNPNKEARGVQFSDTVVNDIHLYLLGKIKNYEEKSKLTYRPWFITTRTNYAFASFETTNAIVERIIGKERRGAYLNHVLGLEGFFFDLEMKYAEYITNHPEFITNKETCYYEFKIPKRTPGEFRTIKAPKPKLKELQHMALEILQKVLLVKSHDCAFAYTKNRSHIQNGSQHQYSNHVVKLDFKDFFTSINKEFIRTQLCSLNEFAILNVDTDQISDACRGYINEDLWAIKIRDYQSRIRTFLDVLLDLATLNNVLPQGTPLSPILSNLVMIPIDWHIRENLQPNKTAEISKTYNMYTRYADDMTFSSVSPINLHNLVTAVNDICQRTSPLRLNFEKTKYMKTSNKCYITGVKINRSHQVTYGHENKAKLKHDLFKILMKYIQIEDKAQYRQEAYNTLGRIAYMAQIEPEYTRAIIVKYATKFGINPDEIYKKLLN